MSSTGVATPNDIAAHTLLRAAHEGSYRFPAEFAGFSADLTLHHDGATTTGTVIVRSPRNVTLEISGSDDAVAWTTRELGSMAGHRWPVSYADGDGRWSLALDPEDGDPGGRLVRVLDDSFASTYRVLGGRIARIERTMGPVRFAITIQDHVNIVGSFVLPKAFTVTFWQADADRLTRADAYTDHYTEVGGVFLPALRRVVSSDNSGITARELVLANHVLLEGTASAFAQETLPAATRAG